MADSKHEETFKVIDRRHFTGDGELRPEVVEMERREHLLGIAEKLPKSPVKLPKAAAARVARRPIVALEGRSLRKRH